MTLRRARRVDPVSCSPLVEDLLEVLGHWSPIGVELHDRGLQLFHPAGRRLLDRLAVDGGLKRRLQNIDTKTSLINLLRERRPWSTNIRSGGSVGIDTAIERFIDGFGLTPSEAAPLLLRALPGWIEGEIGEHESCAADCFRTLKDAFLIAELAWALGGDGTSEANRDIVAAAVESAATIAGVLVRLGASCQGSGLSDDLIVRMHRARMEWIQILLRFDDYSDLVADGGHLLNVRLLRLVGRHPSVSRSRPSRFLHLFEEDPVPQVTDLFAVGPADAGASQLRSRIAEEENHRLLDVAARLLLPRYLIDEAVGMLQFLGREQSSTARSRSSRFGSAARWASRIALSLVIAAISGFLLIAIALLFAFVGITEVVGEVLASCGVLQFLLGTQRVVIWSLPALAIAWVLSAAVPSFRRWITAGFIVVVLFVAVIGYLDRGLTSPAARLLVLQSAEVLRYLMPLLAVGWVISAWFALRRGRLAASYQLLLRVPAAVGFGLAILMALSFEWIDTQSGFGRTGPIVAILAAAVYSGVEFINQGAASRPRLSQRRDDAAQGHGPASSVRRAAFDLTILAAGISMLITTIVLEIFGRTFLTGVAGYQLLLDDPVVYLEALAVLASVSLALGTFLQAIWDDQPITAPLSYVRLRR
jgi:hypothetical protein